MLHLNVRGDIFLIGGVAWEDRLEEGPGRRSQIFADPAEKAAEQRLVLGRIGRALIDTHCLDEQRMRYGTTPTRILCIVWVVPQRLEIGRESCRERVCQYV